jgi:SAM-dependent methyltransferase
VSDFYYEHLGFCPICEAPAKFVSHYSWLRDHYRCEGCGSIPRQRAVMLMLQDLAPNWRELAIHESSPSGPTSDRLWRECKGYVPSFCYPDVPRGAQHNGARCEDLEQLTFADDQFDVVITQEVFEHIFDYRGAFREVMRTVKPGGIHLFTTPKYKGLRKTEDRAIRKADGEIQHLVEPEYHGNPIDSSGSLVTVHYGDDICEIIWDATRCPTTIYNIHDDKSGATAEFMDVFVTRKV